MDLERINEISTNLKAQVGKIIVGQDEAIDLILICLLSEGHILVEGVPGTAKTLMAKTVSACLELDFGRIQFTPDLMPGDVLGTNLFNFQTNQFVLSKGPVFTEFLLADEINRTPPKTQAALLQAMNERTVTIDGTTHFLGDGFIVMATQNPVEQQGTYPLPEAQLDRFLFKHVLPYPSAEQEKAIVMRHGHKTGMAETGDFNVSPVASLEQLRQIRSFVEGIRLSEENVDYIVNIVRNTREHPALQFGASPRSATMLARAARGYAALSGRDYVIPDDIKFLALPVLRHRIILAPGADIEGLTADQVISQIVEQTEAPR